MGKKKIPAIEHLTSMMHQYDPQVVKLAHERLYDGRQLYDSKTHRLRKEIRDEAQGRAVLLLAEEMAKTYERALKLRADEKRLLNKVLQPGGTAILVLMALFLNYQLQEEALVNGESNEEAFFEHLFRSSQRQSEQGLQQYFNVQNKHWASSIALGRKNIHGPNFKSVH